MPSTYFASRDAAHRYERFRPQVHDVVRRWLADAGGAGPFRRALDVGCGTGHSMAPLLSIAERVEGIDRSPEMVAIAAAKGLDAKVADLRDAEPGAYDLLTFCMSFHWLNRDDAVRWMAAASAPGAVWLVYNFGFAGHRTDVAFNRWHRGAYHERFPSPGRGAECLVPSPDERGIELLAHESGDFDVRFSRDALIGYLTTQSNVEAALAPDFGYADAERLIDATMPAVADPDRYVYGFEYSICRFRGAGPSARVAARP